MGLGMKCGRHGVLAWETGACGATPGISLYAANQLSVTIETENWAARLEPGAQAQ